MLEDELEEKKLNIFNLFKFENDAKDANLDETETLRFQQQKYLARSFSYSTNFKFNFNYIYLRELIILFMKQKQK